MGCAESRPASGSKPSSQPLLSTFQDDDDDAFSLPLTMGQQPPPSADGTVQLASQHERLILELLPFQDIRQFHDWLNGVYVRGSWSEFLRDFHHGNPLAAAEPDKATTAQRARDAINSRAPQYLMHNPDKAAWTAEDHHVRFLIAVVSDNMLDGLWSDKQWKKGGLAICAAVFEVLVFLKATTTAAQGPGASDPPRYEA